MTTSVVSSIYEINNSSSEEITQLLARIGNVRQQPASTHDSSSPVADPRPARRTGRRAGDSAETRRHILEAAGTLFAQDGYESTSVRAIATAAKVDPALIRHHFGDKESLLAELYIHNTTIPLRLNEAMQAPLEQRGESLTRAYFQLWEEPETRTLLTAVVKAATTSERAGKILSSILSGGSPHAQPPNTPAKTLTSAVALAGTQLFGIVYARYIIKVPAFTQLSIEDLVATVAPVIQQRFEQLHT